MQNKLNAKINNKFQNIAVQNISDNQVIDGYTFSTGVTGKASITEEKILNDSGKSLKLVVPSGGLYITIKSEEIDCVLGQILVNSVKWFFADATGHAMRFNSYITFYDKDGNTISNSTANTNQADENFNNSRCEVWSSPKQLEFKIIPPRAVKYVITYVINPVKAGNLYITDFYSCAY